jgi:hypothetical protein
MIFVRLNDCDKDKCDLIINELNDKQVKFENKVTKIVIKKIINCVEDILMKLYENKKFNYLDELFYDNKTPVMSFKNNFKPVIKDNNNNNNRLIEEVDRLSKERYCVICLDRSKNIMFLPCAHLGKK